MARTITSVFGFDGSGYSVGDRVEIHPGTDLWMRGVRYGEVLRLSRSAKGKERVWVKLDRLSRPISAPPDRFRAIG